MKMLKIILIILGLIALAFFAIGFVVRELPYEAEVTIEKPVEDVFALFNDMEQLSQWIPEVKHYKIIEDKPGKIGSVMEMTIETDGKEMVMTETVTAFEENQHVAFTFDAGAMRKSNDFRFSSGNGTTMIKASYVAEGTTAVTRSLFVFFKTYFRQLDQSYLDNFKKFAESTLNQTETILEVEEVPEAEPTP